MSADRDDAVAAGVRCARKAGATSVGVEATDSVIAQQVDRKAPLAQEVEAAHQEETAGEEGPEEAGRKSAEGTAQAAPEAEGATQGASQNPLAHEAQIKRASHQPVRRASQSPSLPTRRRRRILSSPRRTEGVSSLLLSRLTCRCSLLKPSSPLKTQLMGLQMLLKALQ